MNSNVRSILTKSAISLCLLFSGCRGAPPKIDLPLWAGDSKNAGVTRAQENRTIACSSPEIDNMVAMRYAELRKLFDVIWSCEKWPKGVKTMNAKEVDEALTLYNVISRKADEVKK